MDLAGIDHQPEDTEKLLNTSAPVILDAPQRNSLDQNGAVGVSAHQSSHTRKKYRHHKSKREKRSTNPGLVKRDVITEEADVDLTILDNCVNREIERTAEQVVLMQQNPAASPGVGLNLDQENCNPRLSLTPKVAVVSSPKTSRVRPTSSPVALSKDTTVSPHHQRRHRHRDKQHQRAMQQVAAWIEREHSVSPIQEQVPTSPNMGNNNVCPAIAKLNAGEHVLIQRHEHHHIHEHHHHHHYHHYHET